MTNKKRIKELEQIIETLDTEFEKGEDCVINDEIILDNEYDALKQELFKLSPNSKIFQTVTASKIQISKDKMIHDPVMTSINKCNGDEKEKEEILNKWFEDCRKINKDIEFSMSYKHDGLALSIEYSKGILVKAGLRSRSGADGINVTDKTKYIQNIPQTLPLNISCIIRGEIETTVPEFERQCEILGEDAKKNPRAHTAGSMNQKTAEQMKDRSLSFIAYNILNLKNAPYKTEIERAKWAEEVLKLKFVETIPLNQDKLAEWEEKHNSLNFKVDGCVLSVNNLEYQKKMGNTGNKETGNPKGKLAWKFKDEIKKTTVKGVEWNTGRIGNITPVLIVEPTELEGTTVNRVTAHNLKVIKDNKIGIGTIIEIIKSGKIIPKIKRIIEAKGDINVPKFCPSCGGEVEQLEGNNDSLSLVCKNSSSCPAQNIKMLNHFLATIGVLGISERTIEKLVDLGAVKTLGDFWSLSPGELLDWGITERTALLIVARLWIVPSPEQIKDDEELYNKIMEVGKNPIKVPMDKFFAAFGIKNSGKEVGRILKNKYNDWEKIKFLSEEELENIDGIGPIISKEIVKFFKENKEMIKDVENNFEFEETKSGGSLEGKVFCLSGKLENGKAYWKNMIEERGGIVKGSVGKSVNILVAGSGSGLKSKKAQELGIPVLTTNELEELLED